MTNGACSSASRHRIGPVESSGQMMLALELIASANKLLRWTCECHCNIIYNERIADALLALFAYTIPLLVESGDVAWPDPFRLPDTARLLVTSASSRCLSHDKVQMARFLQRSSPGRKPRSRCYVRRYARGGDYEEGRLTLRLQARSSIVPSVVCQRDAFRSDTKTKNECCRWILIPGLEGFSMCDIVQKDGAV